MFNRILSIIIFLILFAFITGCNGITKSEKFDKTKWAKYGEFGGPGRDLMAEDLFKNYKIVGLSHVRMLRLLGPPANYSDSLNTYYTLSEDNIIDPVYGKDLAIQFNKDSVIVKVAIEEWRKN